MQALVTNDHSELTLSPSGATLDAGGAGIMAQAVQELVGFYEPLEALEQPR
jgi:hypothetical protein